MLTFTDINILFTKFRLFHIHCSLFVFVGVLNLNIQDENEFTNIKNNSEIMRKVTIKTTVFSCHQNSVRGWGGDIKV